MWGQRIFSGSKIPNFPVWPDELKHCGRTPTLRTWIAIDIPAVDLDKVMQPLIDHLSHRNCISKGVDELTALASTCAAAHAEFTKARQALSLLQVTVTIDRGTRRQQQKEFTRVLTRDSPLIEAYAHETLAHHQELKANTLHTTPRCVAYATPPADAHFINVDRLG